MLPSIVKIFSNIDVAMLQKILSNVRRVVGMISMAFVQTGNLFQKTPLRVNLTFTEVVLTELISTKTKHLHKTNLPRLIENRFILFWFTRNSCPSSSHFNQESAFYINEVPVELLQSF